MCHPCAPSPSPGHPATHRLLPISPPAADAPSYPPGTLEQGTRGIFLVGGTDSDTLLAKGALFTYYLLDAGHRPEGPPADYAALPGCLPPATALEVRSAWLLDDAADHPGSADAAARLIPAVAGPMTPFKFVRALAARGLPDAALSLVRMKQPSAFFSFLRKMRFIACKRSDS